MPSGWERINVKQTTPNKLISFIKPLPHNEKTSKDFLERIAAQCLPIMNKHGLVVVSLEEYEPNLEFWGRNFNGGEVIQLVLKSPVTSQWLPFKFVQMVMMHELAHNKEMNHSAAFHRVRVEFINEMKALWERGYTGDGLWGRGVLLENGAFTSMGQGDGEILPKNLCGGTFKSQGSRKRKIKRKITYKERQERRIKKKFGTNGITLGADEETKAKLEKGKTPAGKPRVAGSARGRELRAAAALARFETNQELRPKDEDLVTDSEAESDIEGDIFIKTETQDAVDINGSRLLDTNGLPLVKVCEDDDKDDENAKNELLELWNFDSKARRLQVSKRPPSSKPATSKPPLRTSSSKQPKNLSGQVQSKSVISNSNERAYPISNEYLSTASENEVERPISQKVAKDVAKKGFERAPSKPRVIIEEPFCMACSMAYEANSLTCTTCSNVLKPEFFPNSWKCKSSLCTESDYINVGDMGLCGVCGTRKCS